jgi:hypothetical protein
MSSHSPVFACTEFQTAVPPRLGDEVAVGQLTDPTLESRGRSPEVADLVGSLRSGLRNEAIHRGQETSLSPIPETEAVDVVLGQLRAQFPQWFGRAEPVDRTVSDEHLSSSEFREWFFQGQVSFETVAVDFEDSETVDRILVPVVAWLDERLADQRAADDAAQRTAAKTRLKRAVIREATESDLSEADVDAAVADAKAALERSDAGFEGE